MSFCFFFCLYTRMLFYGCSPNRSPCPTKITRTDLNLTSYRWCSLLKVLMYILLLRISCSIDWNRVLKILSFCNGQIWTLVGDEIVGSFLSLVFTRKQRYVTPIIIMNCDFTCKTFEGNEIFYKSALLKTYFFTSFDAQFG
jgi:hypothetical protein